MRRYKVNLVFHQTENLGADPAALARCLQAYCDLHLAPAWGVACELAIAQQPVPGEADLIFTDDADQAGTLGYHDEGADGHPRGFVCVRATKRAGESVSVTASHELAELLIDPGCNFAALSPRGRWVALEVCDPCEADTFAVEGLPVSDFVYPSWFGAPGAKYDHLGLCRQPWEILPGGYVPVWAGGRWGQIFGSVEAAGLYGKEDRRLHRTERRSRRGPPGGTGPAVAPELVV